MRIDHRALFGRSNLRLRSPRTPVGFNYHIDTSDKHRPLRSTEGSVRGALPHQGGPLRSRLRRRIG